jgi:MoxR-like ATPase
MDDRFRDLLVKRLIDEREFAERVVLEGQYLRAYKLLSRSVEAGLTPIITGPPGVGKSLLVRKFALSTYRNFYEVFFDELMRPSNLIGSLDPSIVLHKGYNLEAFEPGPLLKAMVEGGIFVAQELNRATEFCQNSLLEPLEERSYFIPRIGRVKADERFAFVAVANPAEMAGVHDFSEALRDRIRVWIPLRYPEKEIELEIIRANCPEYSLEEGILEKVYSIVETSRRDPRLEQPASVRTGISIARLIGRYILEDEVSDGVIEECALSVLSGSIRTFEGDLREISKSIIERALSQKVKANGG